ncbi:MAG: hypothetical protein Q7U66_17790 [Methylobacter sp.]|nr:hypothetical protein [Methylobacter sp.]
MRYYFDIALAIANNPALQVGHAVYARRSPTSIVGQRKDAVRHGLGSYAD